MSRLNQHITRIADSLKGVPDIRALFLSGSFGNGRADAFSDIDFLLVADGGASYRIAAQWRDAVSKLGDIVMWRDRIVRPALINAITEDWTRVDLIICTPEQMSGQSKDALKPLFDHDGRYDALGATATKTPMSAARLSFQIEEFIRIFGLLHLVMGREEYLNGVTGLSHLRNILVEMMIEVTNAPERGGALHVNRLLSDAQKAVLYDLPPAMPDRAALIDAHLAYMDAFRPVASHLARARGLDWPTAFEDATWAMLECEIGLKRPNNLV